MEQFVRVPPSVYNKSLNNQSVTKQEVPKYQLSQNPTYQIDSLEKEIHKKLYAKADPLVDKILSFPRNNLSIPQILKLDGVETGVLRSDFVQPHCRKNADIPEVHFTLLDAAGLSPTLVLNQNAKAKERRSWVPFRTRTTESAKAVHIGWCCFWLCAQFSEN